MTRWTQPLYFFAISSFAIIEEIASSCKTSISKFELTLNSHTNVYDVCSWGGTNGGSWYIFHFRTVIFWVILKINSIWNPGFKINMFTLLQYGLRSFQAGGTKLERFLPKNQHTQRILLNFENWISRGLRCFQKSDFNLRYFFTGKMKIIDF